MYNKARLDTILYNTINQLINEGKNKTSRELLLEGDDRLKKVKRIIQQSFKGTALNTDDLVTSAEYYVGNKGANTTWMDYLLYSVRHTFGLMENKDLPLLVKVAKIAFDELEFEKSENHIDELNTLKAIVNLLKKDANAANRVIKDPNVTYEKLYNEYADVLKQLENDMRYRVNSKEYQKNQRYEIIPIDDFNTANELGKYTGIGNGDGALCYTRGESTWDGYTRNGSNQCYLCYTTDFKDIEPRVTEGYPKDEYGLSMIWLFVDGNGELANSNVRWNHGNHDFKDVDNIFTPEEISDIVGVNFYETFRPNDKWAKKVEEVQYRLKNGEDPSDVFDECRSFKEGFLAVQLEDRYNFINANGEILSPNKWFDFCGNFHEGVALVQLNHKWNLINANGELVSPNQWFDELYGFKEGFARVRLNGKWNFINTNGNLLSPNVWFDDCYDFKDGFADVKLDENSYTIDTKGQLYNEYGEPVNFSLQENRRYRKNKKRVIRITESQLRNMIPFEKFINGCVDKSLRTYLNESLKTYDNDEFNIYDKLEELDISYDFINDWENILEIRTPNKDIKAKVRQLINYYGWKEIKDNGWSICAERIYGDNWNDFYDIEAENDDDYPYGIGIYYHITLSRKVPKILRQGLTVREGNKLGYARGKRIYLMSYPGKEFAYSLFRDHKEKETEVTILLVDIRNYLGKQINIYHDDLTEGDECVYTYDYIPPQCIKVYDTFKIS